MRTVHQFLLMLSSWLINLILRTNSTVKEELKDQGVAEQLITRYKKNPSTLLVVCGIDISTVLNI